LFWISSSVNTVQNIWFWDKTSWSVISNHFWGFEIPNIVVSCFCKFCVMHRFIVFVKFLCFGFFFLCLGLHSYVFTSEPLFESPKMIWFSLMQKLFYKKIILAQTLQAMCLVVLTSNVVFCFFYYVLKFYNSLKN
jgi:hypothetical protein